VCDLGGETPPVLLFSGAMQSIPLVNPTTNLSHRQRLGRCYELSGLIALHNPHVTLVHGSIQGFNYPRIAHAWVELPDGSVWEPVTNKVWHHSIFDGFYRAEVTVRYRGPCFSRTYRFRVERRALMGAA
jgi:hypothetical protein